MRHQIHDEEDPAWLLRADVQRGLAAVGETGLAFDLLVRCRELPAAYETVRRHPRIRFVIDHLAKPPIRDGGSPEWDTWISRLSELPNAYCKLSGLVTEADWREWTLEILKLYVERVLSLFGAHRVMFGSDWPVCLMAASYTRVMETAKILVSELPEDQRAAIFGGNAVTFYQLSSR